MFMLIQSITKICLIVVPLLQKQLHSAILLKNHHIKQPYQTESRWILGRLMRKMEV